MENIENVTWHGACPHDGMAGVKKFQDLVAWQLAMDMSEAIYEITETGPAARDIEYRTQIRSAASKPAPLIAEGFVRFTTPEFVRYLRLARAEIAEVQTHLETGRRRRYFSSEQFAHASSVTDRTMGTITNLLKAKVERRRYGQRPAT
jgi:four helix bundle protein